MKKEQLYELLGDMDENSIKAAETSKTNRRKTRWIRYGAAAAACLGVCAGAGILFGRSGNTPADTVSPGSTDTISPVSTDTIFPMNADNMLLAEAAYPEMPAYPDETMYSDREESDRAYDAWSNARKELRKLSAECTYDFYPFFLNTTRTFLTDAETDNKVYSPLSLFMALGMSAEITDGNTRQQILDVLGQDGIESLRSDANVIWQTNYMDDGMAKCVLATSLWTNNKIPYIQSTMDSLADNYYTSSYSGDPASAEYNKMMQKWMNDQTDGLLSEYVSGIEMDPRMVLTLASTVNYSGKWKYQFSEKNTESGIFHSPAGDISCDFLNSGRNTTYYWGENFASVSLELENNGEMRLILPDEGITPEELIHNDDVMNFLMDPDACKNSKFIQVNMSIPKFDVYSNTDLTDGLRQLGITDAFDPSVSDFTPLTEELEGVFISNAKQSARVMIDEEGCKASSLTVMIYCGAGMPKDQVDFVLDRPFIFEIMSETGLPLFIGIVNTPAV